jgi:hypothetical protein
VKVDVVDYLVRPSTVVLQEVVVLGALCMRMKEGGREWASHPRMVGRRAYGSFSKTFGERENILHLLIGKIGYRPTVVYLGDRKIS